MSGQRPTLRYGLPYRWWTSDLGRDALTALVLTVMVAMLVVIATAYIGGVA
jgi:hypothetical protein